MKGTFIQSSSFYVFLLACVLLTPITAKGQLATPQPVPQDSDTITTLTPTLRWHASPGAASYQIEIYQITHDDPIIRIEADSTEEKYDIPPRKLFHFNRYKWQVRAANSSGPSQWSQAQTFKVLPEFNCDIEIDQDCDGIPDWIEDEHFKTNKNKKTLFVRPKKKIGENNFVLWKNFLNLFPGSSNGIANIPAFVEAEIEVVVIGAADNAATLFQGDEGYKYKPEDHPEWPCDIMEIVLEQADAFYEFEKKRAGHTYISEASSGYTWFWSTKGYTGAGRHHGYGIPVVYPFPLAKYFEEGAYTVIEKEKGPVLNNDNQPVTDCSEDPQDCIHCSPNNLSLTDSPTFNPPYYGLPDGKVEFNEISFDFYGKITKFTGLGKQYTKNEVLARTVVHEMGHALLSSNNAEHCPNPCCIMHRNTLDWEQHLFGPRPLKPEGGDGAISCEPGLGGENGAISCEHSPGGCKDIRSEGVIHNHAHPNP